MGFIPGDFGLRGSWVLLAGLPDRGIGPLGLVSQASLFFPSRGAAGRGGGRRKSGDLSQHFVFSAGMWVEPKRLQQSHDFHNVIQKDSACNCHRCKAQIGYPRLCPKQELAVKNTPSVDGMYS